MRKLYYTTAVHTLILAGILVLFYLFVFSPQREGVSRFDTQVRNRVLEIDESLDALGDITGENSQLSMTRKRVDLLEGRFVPYDMIGEAGLELADWAERQDLVPTRVVPPFEWNGEEHVFRSSPGMEIVEVRIVLGITGTYTAYGKFVESLVDFPYLVVPVGMSLSCIEPGSEPISCVTELRIYALRKLVSHVKAQDEADEA